MSSTVYPRRSDPFYIVILVHIVWTSSQSLTQSSTNFLFASYLRNDIKRYCITNLKCLYTELVHVSAVLSKVKVDYDFFSLNFFLFLYSTFFLPSFISTLSTFFPLGIIYSIFDFLYVPGKTNPLWGKRRVEVWSLSLLLLSFSTSDLLSLYPWQI